MYRLRNQIHRISIRTNIKILPKEVLKRNRNTEVLYGFKRRIFKATIRDRHCRTSIVRLQTVSEFPKFFLYKSEFTYLSYSYIINLEDRVECDKGYKAFRLLIKILYESKLSIEIWKLSFRSLRWKFS